MSIVRVQHAAQAGTNGGTTMSCSWPSPTTAGNLLVAVLQMTTKAYSDATPPAGWTLAVEANPVHLDSGGDVLIYYIENSASRSGSETWHTSFNPYWAIELSEYSGIATSLSLDKTATNTGSGTTANSGTTGTILQANELCIAGVVNGSSVGFSGPTNGFTIVDNPSIAGTSVGVSLEKIETSAATENVSVTSATGFWWGAIATFSTVPIVGTIGLLGMVGPMDNNTYELDYYHNPPAGCVNTVSRVHAYSLLISASSSTQYAALAFRDTTGELSSVNNGNTVYGRFYYYPTYIPGSSVSIFSLGHDASGTWTPGFELKLTSAGKLAVYGGGTLDQTGTTTLSINNWYRIEFHTVANASGAYTLKINGVTELTGTLGATGSVAAALFGSFASGTYGGYYCDGIFRDDVAPGDGACYIIAGTGDNSTGSWTASNAGTLSSCVSTNPYTGTTYAYTTTNNDAFTLNTAGSVPANATINGAKVQIGYRCGTPSNSTTVQPYISSGGTTDGGHVYTSAYISIETGQKFYSNDPHTSAAWTVSGVNAVKPGAKMVSGSTNETRVYFAYWVVDYNAGVVVSVPTRRLLTLGVGR